MDFDTTAEGLQKALDLNIKIQRDLLETLRQISSLKMKLATGSENLRKHQNFQISSDYKVVNGPFKASTAGKKKRQRRTSRDSKEIVPRPRKIAKGWEFNENRKWMRRFFLDSFNYMPPSNQDIIKRRKWEGDLIGVGSYRYKPWSKEECTLLKQSAEKVRMQQQQSEGSGIDKVTEVKDIDIDFNKVTETIRMEKEYGPQKVRKFRSHSSSNHDVIDDPLKLRLPTDYRNKFLYSISDSINKTKLSEEESKIVLKSIRHNKSPSWDIIAQTLNNSRTPFQCFQHVENMSGENIGTLNKDEDDLLLKFIAASGPQLLLGHNITTFLSQNIFPHLSTKQLLMRVNTSLLNPNNRNERWNDFEERMLVLGMKTYCNDVHAISKVSLLFPDRSCKLVTDKWNRSLNPIYSTQPLTKAENDALLKIVNDHTQPSRDWKAISRKIPFRNPRFLMSRYLELSSQYAPNYTFES